MVSVFVKMFITGLSTMITLKCCTNLWYEGFTAPVVQTKLHIYLWICHSRGVMCINAACWKKLNCNFRGQICCHIFLTQFSIWFHTQRKFHIVSLVSAKSFATIISPCDRCIQWQWRWAISCGCLEVNQSQSSTKLFIFGPAFPVLHKVPTKPVWAGSLAQLSNTAHKLIPSTHM